MFSFHQLAIPFAVLLTVVNGQMVATCPSNMTVNVGWEQTSAPVFWTEPTPPSSAYTKTFQTHSQGIFPLGISVVTYEFFDQSSQDTISCTFLVIVRAVDFEPPVISNCPESQIQIEYEVGMDHAAGSWPEPSATDNSGQVVLVERSDSPDEPLYVFGSQNFQVTYTFEDPSGNQAHCTFNVRRIPVDTTPPIVRTCRSLVSETVPLDSLGTVVTLDSPSVKDNSGQLRVRIEPNISNSFFPVGITLLKYIYTDPSGNQATCVVNVHVVRQDTSPPIITYCPESMTYGAHADVGATFVDWDQPTAEDDSGRVIVNAFPDPGFFSIGTVIEVNYDFSDLAENHVSCTFVISVIEDEEPPRIFGCPQLGISAVVQPGNLRTNVTWKEPFAKDDTFLKPLQRNYYPGDEFEIGTTTVEYVFEDSAGNFAVCKFDVAVNSLVDNNEGGIGNSVAVAVIIGVTLVIIVAVVVIAFNFVHFKQKKNTTTTEPSSPTIDNGIERSSTSLATSNRPLPSIKSPSRQTENAVENQNGKREERDDKYYLTPAP